MACTSPIGAPSCLTAKRFVSKWVNKNRLNRFQAFSNLAHPILEDGVVKPMPMYVADPGQIAGHGRGSWERHSMPTALASLERMTELPSVETYILISQKCRKLKNLAYAKQLHMHICNHRLESHGELGNYLVPMFVDCGSVAAAMVIFDRLAHRKEHSWTSLIHGCIESGEPQQALDLFRKMQEDCVYPSKFTFTALLKACARLKFAGRGQELHSELAQKGLERELFIGSTLVDLYAKCGLLMEAWEVFVKLPVRNLVSWSSLIFGFTEHGLGREALNKFEQMEMEGVCPDVVTLICGLRACGSIGAIDRGRKLHIMIAKEGLERDLSLHNSLVAMYAECGSLLEAQTVFDELPVRDLISWTALIRGYADHGFSEEALNCLHQMQLEDISADLVAHVCCLKACGAIGAIDKGKEIHSEIVKKGLKKDTLNSLDFHSDSQCRVPAQICGGDGPKDANELVFATALIDMYSKCSSMVDSQKVFDSMPVRDLVAWTALIAGYAFQGESELVFHYFERMKVEGIQPDGIVFLSVIAACTHGGLLDKAQDYFEAMHQEYGITPIIEHLNCMVDLLGRAGQLIDAVALLEKMPVEPDLVTWNTILGACRKWGNVELARHAFDCAVKLDKQHVVAYILMANIYMDAHMWEEAKMIEAMGMNKQVVTDPGKSWIVIGGIVHTFVVGETNNYQSNAMYAKLKHLRVKIEMKV